MVHEFVVPIKPISANRGPSKPFTSKIGKAAKRYNFQQLLNSNLFARIIWFHRAPHGKEDCDTDNIAKRILDSLEKYAYMDDAAVCRCYIDRIFLSDSYLLENFPWNDQVGNDLQDLLGDPEHKHILYVAVGNIDSSVVIFKLGN